VILHHHRYSQLYSNLLTENRLRETTRNTPRAHLIARTVMCTPSRNSTMRNTTQLPQLAMIFHQLTLAREIMLKRRHRTVRFRIRSSTPQHLQKVLLGRCDSISTSFLHRFLQELYRKHRKLDIEFLSISEKNIIRIFFLALRGQISALKACLPQHGLQSFALRALGFFSG
jgi:hypothetical protein